MEPRQLSVRRLADVEMRSIEWLDRPLFQRAAFHLVAGKKGAGKGTYLAGLAARASLGGLFGRPMNVLLVASEDSDEIDVKPRVRAAGGDESRIYSVDDELLLPRDIETLKQTALALGDVGLIILDPIASHVRGDTHHEEPVRNAIDPLNALANELDCLLIGVRHLSEKETSKGAIAAILGASAWVQIPRAVLAVAADDEHDMTFHIAVVAGNRSARGAGRMFRLELADVGLKEPVTRAVELGDSAKSVDELLGQERVQGRAVKRDGAAEVILRELAIEPRPLDYLKARCASETGCSGETAYRAAQGLKADGLVTSRNSGPGTPWLWSLTSYSDPLTATDYKVNDSVTETGLTPLTSYSQEPLEGDGKVIPFPAEESA
jgi:hypothetical protein